MYFIKWFPLLCRQLLQLIGAGVSLQVALSIIAQDTKNVRYKRRLEQVLTAIKQGESLPRSLSYLLPDYCDYTVGVDADVLDVPLYLERLAHFYEDRLKVFRKTIVSLVYPVFLLFFSIVLALSFILFLLPMYVSYFEQSSIVIPRFLMSLNSIYVVMSTYPIPLFSCFVIALLCGGIWFFCAGRYVIISWLFGYHHSDLLWHFGTYLQQGVSLRVVLSHDFSGKSGIKRHQWQQFYTLFLETCSFSRSWTHVFSLSHYHSDWLLGIEKTSDFGRHLSELADAIRTDIWTKKLRYLSFIQPCLIVGIGVMVGVFVYTIYIPILSWN